MAGEYSVGGLALISSATRANQRSQILRLLISARGSWVPLPKIAELACQYNARLYELRRLGFRIANNRIACRPNGQKRENAGRLNDGKVLRRPMANTKQKIGDSDSDSEKRRENGYASSASQRHKRSSAGALSTSASRRSQ